MSAWSRRSASGQKDEDEEEKLKKYRLRLHSSETHLPVLVERELLDGRVHLDIVEKVARHRRRPKQLIALGHVETSQRRRILEYGGHEAARARLATRHVECREHWQTGRLEAFVEKLNARLVLVGELNVCQLESDQALAGHAQNGE